MRPLKLIVPVISLAALAFFFPTSAQQDLPFVSEARFQEWLDNLNNWGRWGAGDEIGTLNLITPQKR